MIDDVVHLPPCVDAPSPIPDRVRCGSGRGEPVSDAAPRRSWGVRRQAIVAAVVTTALALATGGVVLLIFLQNDVVATAEERTAALSQQLAEEFSTNPIAAGQIPQTSTAHRGTVVQIVAADGTVLATTDPDLAGTPLVRQLPPDGVTVTDRTTSLESLADSDELVWSATGFVSGGESFVVVVASPVEIALRTVRTIAWYLLGAAPILLALVGWGTSYIVGRALSPVARIRAQVDRIGRSRLNERVEVPPTRDEISDLAATMNRMLERLQASDRSQRQLVSDVSHELRSPIASLAAALEVIRNEGAAAAWPDLGPVIESENSRMARLVDDLLTLAKADDMPRQLNLRQVDIDDLLHAEAAILRAKSAHRVAARAEPVQVRCDPDRIGQVVRNLLDNAARHARSRIELSSARDADDVVITVTNDGPPIPEQHRDRVFDRFTRLDDSRSRDSGNAGLGLAIVREIVLAHGGQVSTGANQFGECVFVVRLPLSPPVLRENADHS